MDLGERKFEERLKGKKLFSYLILSCSSDMAVLINFLW